MKNRLACVSLTISNRLYFATFFLVLATLVAAPASAVSAGQVDDFEDGTVQGWTEGNSSPNPPTNINTGGPAGVNDNFLRNIASGAGPGGKLVHINEVQWTGDYLAEGIVEIKAQVKLIAGDEILLRVGFKGTGEAGKAGWVSSSFERVTSNGLWKEVVFSIAEADLTNTGTSLSYQQTMSDVEEIRIFHSMGANWNGGPNVNMTMGLDNIEAVGPTSQEYQGWLWEYDIFNSFFSLDEESCFGVLNLEIFEDDTWFVDGENACWGRTTTNTNPARNYFGYDGASFTETETFEAQSTRPLVSAGGNLLELVGEDVEMGVGQGEGRLATILADPDDGDLLIVGGYSEFILTGVGGGSGYLDLLVKSNAAAAATRTPAQLEGRWRLSTGFRELFADNDPNIKIAYASINSVVLGSNNGCTFEVSDIFPDADYNLSGDGYLLTQADFGATGNLTDRRADASVTDSLLSACTWEIDTDGYLAVSFERDGTPLISRFVISDDNNYLVNAPSSTGIDDNPRTLTVGYKAPSAAVESDIDGTFLFYLVLSDFLSTGAAHSLFETGPQELDQLGRGFLTFDSQTPVATPPGQSGSWFACDLGLVLSDIEYQADGEPAIGTVFTSVDASTEDIPLEDCAFRLDSDGGTLLYFNVPDDDDPVEEIVFAGYTNTTGDLITLLDFESVPAAYSDTTPEDEGSIRQLIAMRYTGDLAADEDGDGLTNLEEFQFPLPPPIESDVTAFADTSGDGTPDFASFVSEPFNQPRATVSSGADGTFVRNLNFLNPDWTGVAIDTIDDSNGDGVADDPGVAMLLVEPDTGKLLVQGRVASSGANINKINFLSADWAPVDVVVFNDPNGDGNPEDAAIGVMAVNKTTGKILLQVRDLGTGAKIATRSFLNPDYTPIAAAAVSRAGLTPLLGVLGVENATGKILVQTRQLSDGLFIDNRKYLDTNWTAVDMAAVLDGNSDGTADDPGWLVAASNDNTGANLVQARFVTNGAFIKNRGYLTPDYLVEALATSADISGNGREEASAFAKRLSNDQRIIQVRDFADGSRTINIFP